MSVLPVSTPASATFAALFSDASTDPTNGHPRAIMSPFLHDLANPATNVSTDDIRGATGKAFYAKKIVKVRKVILRPSVASIST